MKAFNYMLSLDSLFVHTFLRKLQVPIALLAMQAKHVKAIPIMSVVRLSLCRPCVTPVNCGHTICGSVIHGLFGSVLFYATFSQLVRKQVKLLKIFSIYNY